jgi:predicted nucleic acid-binding Zn ribbon protein
MSPEKETTLVKTFPHLFRDRNAPMIQTAMCWGIDTNDGWFSIIYEACSKIEPIVKKMIDDALKSKDHEELDFIPAFSQIKEKYGRLCLYLTTGTDEIYDIVDEAEKKSAKTCEQCGNKGKLRGTGWVFTMCNKCWKEYKEKHGQ